MRVRSLSHQREMASLKDFIPDAQFHESNGDFETAIEVYTKGIDSLPNGTSNTWRLYWSRAGLKIKLAQNVFEKAGKSTETEWELQQKLYTEAEHDLKQAIKGQESNARKVHHLEEYRIKQYKTNYKLIDFMLAIENLKSQFEITNS